MRPRKVLVVMGPVAQGGAEWQLYELLRRMDRTRFSPAVASVTFRQYRNLSITEGDRPIRDAFDSLEVPHYPLTGHGAYSPRNTEELYRIIRRGQFDLVHTNLFAGETHGRAAALAAGVPIVTQKRSMPFLTRRSVNVLADWLLNLASSRIVLPSRAVLNELLRFERLPADRLSVVYAGVDRERWRPVMSAEQARLRAELGLEGASVLASVGRLMPIKGHRSLLVAMPSILRCHPNTVLLLVGHGVLTDRYRTLAERLGVEGSVRFLGGRSDVREILSITDLFVFPSLQESFGIALVEAALMGVAAVASHVGGVPEIVDDGRTGVLVPVRSPSRLAEAVCELLSDRPRLRAMGRAAQLRAEQLFTLDRTVREIEREYLQAVGLRC